MMGVGRIHCGLWPSEHGGIMKGRGITVSGVRAKRARPVLHRKISVASPVQW